MAEDHERVTTDSGDMWQCHHQRWLPFLFSFFYLFTILFTYFVLSMAENLSLLLFIWLLVDFVRVWRFGFGFGCGFERWNFVVVFGLIWLVAMVAVIIVLWSWWW